MDPPDRPGYRCAIPTINATVESRLLSALEAEHVGSGKGPGLVRQRIHRRQGPPWSLRTEQALYASITSYAQGLNLLKTGLPGVPLESQPGAISSPSGGLAALSAPLLSDITQAYRRDPPPAQPAPG